MELKNFPSDFLKIKVGLTWNPLYLFLLGSEKHSTNL